MSCTGSFIFTHSEIEDFHFCMCIVLVNAADLMVQQETWLGVFWKSIGFCLYWGKYAINKLQHNERNLIEISYMAILTTCSCIALQRAWTIWTSAVNLCNSSSAPGGHSRRKQLSPGGPFSCNTQMNFEKLFLPLGTKYSYCCPISPLSFVISAHCNSVYPKPVY